MIDKLCTTAIYKKIKRSYTNLANSTASCSINISGLAFSK